MKTIKILYAIGLVLLLSGYSSLYAGTSSDEHPISGNGFGIAKVTYVVNIEHNLSLSGFSCNYSVVVTDQNGNAVAPAQPFRVGVWTYTFYGFSNAGRTRVAKMSTDSRSICVNAYSFQPQTLTGHFDYGKTYTFTLSPQPATP